MVKDYKITIRSKHNHKSISKNIKTICDILGDCRIFEDTFTHTKILEIKQNNLVLDSWFMKIHHYETKHRNYNSIIEITCTLCLNEEVQKIFVDRFIVEMNRLLNNEEIIS